MEPSCLRRSAFAYLRACRWRDEPEDYGNGELTSWSRTASGFDVLARNAECFAVSRELKHENRIGAKIPSSDSKSRAVHHAGRPSELFLNATMRDGFANHPRGFVIFRCSLVACECSILHRRNPKGSRSAIAPFVFDSCCAIVGVHQNVCVDEEFIAHEVRRVIFRVTLT